MHVALHSWSFREALKQPGFNLLRELDETARMGFGAIEIMAGKAGGDSGDFESFDIMYLDRVTRHARAVGVSIAVLASYNDFAYTSDESWRLANIAFVKQMLMVASDMQVPAIRVLTGYLVEGVPREKLEQLVIDAFRECAPVAEKCRVDMALENHSSVFPTAEALRGLIDTVGSSRLKPCPDPTNFCTDVFEPGATREQHEHVYQQTTVYARNACNSHVKFKGFDSNGHWNAIDIQRLLAIYRDIGYDGGISIESIDEPHLLGNLPAARTYLEREIDRDAR